MSKLVAIVGPTASGKSALALEVARRHKGEIICADSRTIYRGMDIGTAKPTKAEQAEIPHHLLDIVDPDESFSAAEFKTKALAAISQIESRGHLPILVGGSGLYLYSVLYDYDFPAGPDNLLRRELQAKPLPELVELLCEMDPRVAEEIDLANPRRVIRAIETAGSPRQQSKLRSDAILVGLKPTDEELSKRIAGRTDQMLKAGLEQEAKRLVERYDQDLEAFRSPGYAEVVEVIKGDSYDFELPDLIDMHTHQLAKRQMTWFKRNSDIHWFDDRDQALQYIEQQL